MEKYKAEFFRICNLPSSDGQQRVEFLRQYLGTLNEFLYERQSIEEIDALNVPADDHPGWKRITPFLAIWDDYAESVIGFKFDDGQIRRLAKALAAIFHNSPELRAAPSLLEPDAPVDSLGGITPRQFALIRLMHALQDFSQVLPPIDRSLVTAIRQQSDGQIPNEQSLSSEIGARRLLAAFGGADRNVEERLRYIFSSARILLSLDCGGAFGLASKCSFDVRRSSRS
ncbi:MAG: hypothetical protein HY897_10700 [Deltaproteobacteria bacterium]|nr:hypothetical protein [Deltaproteobacteria bacterium]